MNDVPESPSGTPDHLVPFDTDNVTREEYLERLVWTLEKDFEELLEEDRDLALKFLHDATDVFTAEQINRLDKLCKRVDDLVK